MTGPMPGATPATTRARSPVPRLALVLVVALVLWAILARVRSAREDRIGGLDLGRVDTAGVDSIFLQSAHDSAVVFRHGLSWRVDDYAHVYGGDSTVVDQLLRGLRDTSAWTEQVSMATASHARFSVDATFGRHVRVATSARSPLDLIVGKRTNDFAGIYVRRPADSAVYALHSGDLADALSHGVDDYRDKRVANVPADSVGSMALQRGGRTVTVRRAGTGWSVDGAPADSAAIVALLDAYRPLTASGFATTAQADSAQLDHPRFSATLRSRTDKPLAALRFDSSAAGVFARADTSHIVYRLDPYALARILPPDATLRRKGKP
ncbi:MAG TPA: DUF4340 domain-containing protein [Gemmatimonadaceae bacterium]|nr:DUF4340 domain-containing protein [Gemmatimonadaceae bacterium]